MNIYLEPIKKAFIYFPIIAMLVTFPFLVYQWRKHKYLNRFRAFIFYTFILYLMCAYFLVILPLPSTRDVKSFQKAGTELYQLLPFSFISTIIKETRVNINDPFSYVRLFTERAFLQVAFNAILLSPLGVYLRYYFNRSLKSTIGICFLTSLFFEVTQITGLYGIYNSPYRLFDVDDLILNTLGGIIGYAITPIFRKFLPDTRKLDQNVEVNGIKIGFVRRFIAFCIDFIIIIIISVPISFVAHEISISIAIFLYLVVGLYKSNGMTVGNYAVSIRVQGRGEKLKFSEAFLRNALFYGIVFGVNDFMSSSSSLLKGRVEQIFIIVFMLCFNGLIAISYMASFISKDKLLFYERMSATRNVPYFRENSKRTLNN